jgi:FkbM family methyltransferase
MTNGWISRLWGLRRPRRLASVVLRRLGLSHLFTIHTNGIRLRFFPAVWTINLWETPDIFSCDTELLRRWLRPGDVFVDCGANVGLMTLVASRLVGPGGAIYAIEAHPKIFRFLQSNVALNDARNVTLFHLAVGEKEGSVSFSDQPADDGNHVLPNGAGLTVDMKPLDSIIPPDTSVRLLKLDVEGYEKLVVEGAGRLPPQVEAVYFEASEMLFARYGYTCGEMFKAMREAGFTIFRLGEGVTLERMPHAYIARDIENLMAVRKSVDFIRHTGLRIVEPQT